MKRTQHYLLTEPFTWIFFCFFQPIKFKREFEKAEAFQRFTRMLRLTFPIFLLIYPLELIEYLIFMRLSVRQNLDLIVILAMPAFYGIISIGLGFAVGFAGGVAYGIAYSIYVGLLFGVGTGISGGIGDNISVILVLSIAGGIACGVARGFILRIAFGVAMSFALGLAIAVAYAIAYSVVALPLQMTTVIFVGGLIGGIAFGLALGIAGGTPRAGIPAIVGGVVLGVALGILRGIAYRTPPITSAVISTYAITLTMYFLGVGFVYTLFYIISKPATRIILRNISLNITIGMKRSLKKGIALFVAICMAIVIEKFNFGMPENLIRDATINITLGIIFGTAFTLSYILGYYRLPLYPISALSVLKEYFISRQNPPEVFNHLHRSALYWDENVFLPLPYLKRFLIIASKEDADKTLEEIAFIVTERPSQIRAAQEALLGIAVHDMEQRKTIVEIAGAFQNLTNIFSEETGLVNPRWVTPFAHLRDASQDANRYCSPLSWRARRSSLEDIKADLRKIHPEGIFKDIKLNNRICKVVDTWLEAVRQEEERLERIPRELGRLDNPYNPGQVLKLGDTLFVGRRDLAQRLEEALGRKERRPTFFLYGERRMGKSSTLKQLPIMLGSHYLPIFYDLQVRGMSSNVAIFLATIAEEICRAMNVSGAYPKKLEYEHLREAMNENDAIAYAVFDEWFSHVEKILEQEGRTLLLTFDEFEKLEEAAQAKYFNLRLLLDWFRSIIQHRPRLAFLYSGIHTFDEMGAETNINWSGYFVNVRTLNVSFLKVEEARQLITQPVPDFPSSAIFGEGVVAKIISETACHPFLVQAVCSELIDNLNADKRERAYISDVTLAVNCVLENWWDSYFRDLWNRTDSDQRRCLALMTLSKNSTPQRIKQQSKLDKQSLYQTLQILQRRDLVICNDNSIYQITSPIFREWVKRNMYLETEY